MSQTPWTAEAGLRLVRSLARQVHRWHEERRLHGAITADAVTLDERSEPLIKAPVAGAQRPRFGGQYGDPELCPPFLADGDVLELPEAIDAAAALLRQRQLPFDPRQIDVYQLGTLLCRLVTGKSVLVYMYDPRTKAALPPAVGGLLERVLTVGPDGDLANCTQLAEAIDEAIRELGEASGDGSLAVPNGSPDAGPDESGHCGRESPDESGHYDRPMGDGGEGPLQSATLPTAGDDTPAHGRDLTGALSQQLSQPDDGSDLPFRRLGVYTVVSRIGGGGMGDVYLAHDESLHRPVALKVLPPELARDEQFVRRFRAEATAAAKVVHPNVVPIYAIDNDAGHHFFAMQYVEGESLAALLARRKRLAPTEAAELIRQCLAGLGAAHAAGLIHRDVKPGNILIERSTGRAMLVDFGLVRQLGDGTRMTHTGVIMGTVDYIAPEQARGAPVDERTDLYSLGVMFYQLLSGSLPFEGDTAPAVMFQHAYEPPRPLDQLAPETPEALVSIIARLMAKEPEDRYQDTQSVTADLDHFLSSGRQPGEGSSSPLPEPAHGGATSQGRYRRLALTAAIGACFVLALAAAMLVRPWQPSPPEANVVPAVPLPVEPAPSGSVDGVLFEDLNQDGVRDAGEPGLAGWTLELRPVDRVSNVERTYRASTEGLGSKVVADGDKVIVGATDDDTGAKDAGAVFLFDAASGERVRTIFNPDPGIGERFGRDLAVSGNDLLVGVPWDGAMGEDAGTAYLFAISTGKLKQSYALPHRADRARAGYSVALMGDLVAVGAPGTPVGNSPGAVHLYDRESGRLLRTLPNPTPEPGDCFGVHLTAIDGKLLVGASNDNTTGTSAGAAYLFDPASGELLETFVSPLRKQVVDGLFGFSTANLDGRAAIGMPGYDGPAEDCGIVYLFDIHSGSLVTVFENPVPVARSRFGMSMAAVGGDLLVGCPKHSEDGRAGVGEAYLLDGSTGTTLLTLRDPSPREKDSFGWSVAAMGANLLVSANHAAAKPGQGTVYLFEGAARPLTAVTDADGRYHFRGVADGACEIRYRLPEGYRPAAAGRDARRIVVGGEQDLAHVDFGVSRGSPD